MEGDSVCSSARRATQKNSIVKTMERVMGAGTAAEIAAGMVGMVGTVAVGRAVGAVAEPGGEISARWSWRC